MIISPDYETLHRPTFEKMRHRVAHTISASAASFSTHQICTIDGKVVHHSQSYYDQRFLYADDAEYLETLARLRGLGLYAAVQMVEIMNDEDGSVKDTDSTTRLDVVDRSTVLPTDGGYLAVSLTGITAAEHSGSSQIIELNIDGCSERLEVLGNKLGIFSVRDTVNFFEDPEMKRVYEFLLPHLSNEQHATLLSLVSGRVRNVTGAAATLLEPFKGLSLEDEANRILDIVVDRSIASSDSMVIASHADTPPDEDRLKEWLARVSYTGSHDS